MSNSVRLISNNQEKETPESSILLANHSNLSIGILYPQEMPVAIEEYIDVESIDEHIDVVNAESESSKQSNCFQSEVCHAPSQMLSSGSPSSNNAVHGYQTLLFSNLTSEVSAFDGTFQSHINHVLKNQNNHLQRCVDERNEIIAEQKIKIAHLRQRLRDVTNGRPRKPINKALSKSTKREHLKKFYEENGITVREAFKIMPNKLSAEEDVAIMTAIGMTQHKRRKLKMLLIKYGCDVLASNNNVEHLLMAQKVCVNTEQVENEKDGSKVAADASEPVIQRCDFEVPEEYIDVETI